MVLRANNKEKHRRSTLRGFKHLALSNSKPLFRLYRTKLALVILESVPIFFLILTLATFTFDMQGLMNIIGLILLFVIIFVMFRGEDFFFYDDHVRIERLFRAKMEIPYDQFVLFYPSPVPRPLRRLAPKALLKLKDGSLKMKPIEITKPPKNKNLHLNLVNWLETKVERET